MRFICDRNWKFSVSRRERREAKAAVDWAEVNGGKMRIPIRNARQMMPIFLSMIIEGWW